MIIIIIMINSNKDNKKIVFFNKTIFTLAYIY